MPNLGIIMTLPTNFKLPADFKNHAITFLSLDGEEMLSTQENLFELIQRSNGRFVIDNNIPWFKLSKMPEHVDSAFVLGTTLDHESSPPRLLLEDSCGNPKICQNVFQFGMKTEVIANGNAIRYLIISRLDAHSTVSLNMNLLRQIDHPCGGSTNWNRTKSIAEEKEKILSLLSIKRIEQVTQLPDRQTKDEHLRLCIERKKPESFKRFWGSDDVARFAYCRLLLEWDRISKEARKEFADANYPNVFGDLHLIQNALFFNAGLASHDKAVKRMATFCGLRMLA
jgi:hypothetical protein